MYWKMFFSCRNAVRMINITFNYRTYCMKLVTCRKRLTSVLSLGMIRPCLVSVSICLWVYVCEYMSVCVSMCIWLLVTGLISKICTYFYLVVTCSSAVWLVQLWHLYGRVVHFWKYWLPSTLNRLFFVIKY